MALSNKKTVLAVAKETTENTPVLPSAAGDYLALQNGFEVSPAFAELENNEITGSIGKAKSTLGLENPTASFDHYIKHSGTEGEVPEISDLLESFFGSCYTLSSEYTTTTGSTAGDSSARAIIKLSDGGDEYSRGKAILLKDATNGYAIRPVYSVSTNDLSLGFNLSAAVTGNVGCGKYVNYSVAEEDHPSLTMTYYRANGGATEVVSGAKVNELSISAVAGEYVNGSFSFAGAGYYFDPIEITDSNKYIDFNDGGGEENVMVATKLYKDPQELAAAIETAMGAATTDTITVSYSSSDGKFTIASDGTLSLLWASGTNTASSVGGTIGFAVLADDTGETSYTSDSAISFDSPYTPSYDSNQPLVAKNNQVMFGDYNDYVCFPCNSITFNGSNSLKDLLSICATSGKSGNVATAREVTVEISSYLNKYDADKFNRYREGTTTSFCYNFGEKSGGNWVAGRCASLYIPTASITSLALADDEGLVQLNMTLTAYVDGGLGEYYLNFL